LIKWNFLKSYISRNDEEILKLEESNKNNIHKTKSLRQDFLEALKLKEKKEYQEGFGE